MTVRIRSLFVGLAFLLPLAGCGRVYLGGYQAAGYDVYRPRRVSEPVVINPHKALPIQKMTMESTGQVVHAIPLVIELAEGSPVSWRDLKDAFTLYELRSSRERAVVRSTKAFLLARVDEDGGAAYNRLSDFSAEFDAGSLDAAKAAGDATLESLTVRNIGGSQTILLVCGGEGAGNPCVRTGRKYEIHIAPPPAARSQLARVTPAVYPFEVENRSIPLTAGIGSVLIIALLRILT